MSDNKQPKPLERVAKIEAALDRIDIADTHVDHTREELAAMLQTVLIEQAIDRLTRAVNNNTKAINFGNDRIYEERDREDAAEAEAIAEAAALRAQRENGEVQ